MSDHSDVDHYHAARDALASAEDALEFIDRREAPTFYTQLAIGHALLRIAEALDRMGDDLGELQRRGDASRP